MRNNKNFAFKLGVLFTVASLMVPSVSMAKMGSKLNAVKNCEHSENEEECRENAEADINEQGIKFDLTTSKELAEYLVTNLDNCAKGKAKCDLENFTVEALALSTASSVIVGSTALIEAGEAAKIADRIKRLRALDHDLSVYQYEDWVVDALAKSESDLTRTRRLMSFKTGGAVLTAVVGAVAIGYVIAKAPKKPKTMALEDIQSTLRKAIANLDEALEQLDKS